MIVQSLNEPSAGSRAIPTARTRVDPRNVEERTTPSSGGPKWQAIGAIGGRLHQAVPSALLAQDRAREEAEGTAAHLRRSVIAWLLFAGSEAPRVLPVELSTLLDAASPAARGAAWSSFVETRGSRSATRPLALEPAEEADAVCGPSLELREGAITRRLQVDGHTARPRLRAVGKRRYVLVRDWIVGRTEHQMNVEQTRGTTGPGEWKIENRFPKVFCARGLTGIARDHP